MAGRMRNLLPQGPVDLLRQGTRRWYLRAIDALASDVEVQTVSIRGEEWQEVDFPADVEAAQALTARWAKSS